MNANLTLRPLENPRIVPSPEVLTEEQLKAEVSQNVSKIKAILEARLEKALSEEDLTRIKLVGSFVTTQDLSNIADIDVEVLEEIFLKLISSTEVEAQETITIDGIEFVNRDAIVRKWRNAGEIFDVVGYDTIPDDSIDALFKNTLRNQIPLNLALDLDKLLQEPLENSHPELNVRSVPYQILKKFIIDYNEYTPEQQKYIAKSIGLLLSNLPHLLILHSGVSRVKIGESSFQTFLGRDFKEISSLITKINRYIHSGKLSESQQEIINKFANSSLKKLPQRLQKFYINYLSTQFDLKIKSQRDDENV